MKSTTALFILVLAGFLGKAQCTITLKSDDNAPIKFKIKIQNCSKTDTLRSEANGKLIIADSIYKKCAKAEYIFKFSHENDDAYYSYPQVVRKVRTLEELCGQQPMVARKRE